MSPHARNLFDNDPIVPPHPVGKQIVDPRLLYRSCPSALQQEWAALPEEVSRLTLGDRHGLARAVVAARRIPAGKIDEIVARRTGEPLAKVVARERVARGVCPEETALDHVEVRIFVRAGAAAECVECLQVDRAVWRIRLLEANEIEQRD